MTQPRMNLYGFPHKGLRRALSKLGEFAGKTDYSNAQSLAELQALGQEVKDMLDHHAHIEETFVLAELEKKAPGSTRDNLDEHKELEHEFEQCAQFLQGLSPASPHMDSGKYYSDYFAFFSKYINHMAMEENKMNALIWEHFSDQELGGWHGRIVSSFKPEETLTWFKYIVPALNPFERKIILGGLKGGAPAAFFDQILGMLKEHMSGDEHAQLVAMVA